MPEKHDEIMGTLAKVLPYISSHLRGSIADQVAAFIRLTDEDGCRDPQLQKQIIHRGLYRTMRMLNNLNAAEMLASEESFYLQNEDLVRWIDNICRQAEGLFATKNVKLHWDSPLHHKVTMVNPEKLEFLMWQLLSNALKFTPEGGSVSVSLKEAPGQVMLRVSDTGCGIPEEMLDLVFERFLHTERIDALEHGIGLGLCLCRQIALRHGGRLLLDSRVGEGTTVTVSLPDKRSDICEVRSPRFDYAGGFSRVHIALSDGLPLGAFSDVFLGH